MLPIETERLRLRFLESRDAVTFARYRSDDSVARYQSWEAMSVEDAHAFIGAHSRHFAAGVGEWSQLAIADKLTDEIIGDIGVCLTTERTAEIGFTLAPNMQGMGLATEACRAAIDLLFHLTEVMTLEAVIDSRNVSAVALVKRLGMSLDRTETAEFKGALCIEHHFVLHR